jgi:tetratricopeptide (TPR) repeat protein
MAPTNSDVLFAMGLAEVGLGDVDAGAQAFTKALHWNPKHIDSARELAIADLKLGRSDKADAQLAALKLRAAKCAGACKDASDLQGAIDAIERASNRLAAPPAPASPSGGS